MKQEYLNKTIIYGHLIECFDTILYGFLAVMLAPTFFPSISPFAGILASYGAFAAGFLSRPFGAIFFGTMGDKEGRKKPLLLSMALVGIPTLGMGITPSYESIGILAPVLLIIFRIAQGFFIGGEFTGVILYVYENQSKGTLGLNTGILMMAARIGGFLAAALAAAVSLSSMPYWVWRVPFIVGGIAALLICLFLKKIKDTDAFTNAQQEKSLLLFPWKEVFYHHKRPLVVACLLTGLTIMPLYLATIFGNRLFIDLGFSHTESLILNMLALALDGVLVFLFGLLADKIGFRFQTILGSFLIAIAAFPAFYFIAGEIVSLMQVCLFITVLIVAGGMLNGCAITFSASFFPTNCRYSGSALSVTLGYALLGGTSPLIGSFLMDITQSRMAPAFWLFIVSLTTTFCSFFLKEGQDFVKKRNENL
jgi:MHS family proline/betaine transporter-like MFS transporter